MKNRPSRLLKPLRRNRPPLNKLPEPLVEPLEQRQLLAAIAWDGGPDGTGTNLADPVNWAGDILPGPADDATINSVGSPLTLTTILTVNSLTSNRDLAISGELAINAAASISSTINLTGGSLVGGSWNLTNPVGVRGTSSGGFITNANINGTIVLDITTGQPANLQIEGTTRFFATRLRGNGSELAFAPGYVLNDTITAEGASGGVRLLNFQGTARIGPTGSLGFAAGTFTTIICSASTQFRNAGTINATGLGTAIRVEAPGFLNTGTITLNQGSLQLGSGTFINEGIFTSQNGFINLPAITNRAQFSLVGTGSAVLGTGTFRNEGTLAITGIPATLGGSLINTGSISLQNATLRLTSAWSSTGTITARGSTLTLASNVATSSLNIPGWSLTTTTVSVEAILNNVGSVTALTPSSGQWNLAGGTINDGIFSLAPGVSINAVGSSSLVNVAVQGSIFVAPSGVLELRGVARADRITLSSNASVNFLASEPFEGEIVATGVSANRGISFNVPFTLGQSGRVRIDSTSTGNFNILSNSSTAGFTNRGQITIESPTTTVTVTAPSFANIGTFTAPAASTITLNTAFSSPGTFTAPNSIITISVPSAQANSNLSLAGLSITGSSVTFSGTLLGPSLDFTGRTIAWRFNNAIINSGTIIAPSGQVTFGPNVTLATTVLTGDFTIAAGGAATFTSTPLPQTLRVARGGSAAFTTPVTITSTIIAGPDGIGPSTLTFNAAATLAAAAQFQFAAASLGLTINGSATVTNAATIDVGSRALVFDVQRLVNQGTLRAASSGAIDLGRSFTNTGTIQGSNSTITLRGAFTTADVNFATYTNPSGNTIIQGPLDNTGASFEINTSTGSFLVNSTITGGTITFSGGVSTLSIGPGGNLVNVNLVDPNLNLIIGGSVTLSVTDIAAVTLLPGAVLRFTNAVNIRGGIFTQGGIGNRTIIFDQPSTLAATARVDVAPGSTGIVTFARGTAAGTLTSLGSIDLRGGSMVIDLPFTNSGSMNFANSTNLTISAPWSSPGRIQGENCVYTFTAPFAVTGTWDPQRFTNRGGTVNVRTTVDNTAGVLPLTFESGRWVLEGAVINGGTITTGSSVYLIPTSTMSVLNDVQILDAVRIEQGTGLTVSGSTRFYAMRVHGGLLLGAGYVLRDTVTSVFGFGGLQTANGGPLVIAPGGAIRVTNTFTTSPATFFVVAGSITNNGYIGAESANANINLGVATFVNNGILGLFGGRITVGGLWNGSAGLGTLQGDPILSPDSSIAIGVGGVLDLGGSTLSLLNSLGQLGLAGGVIRNGTVALASGRSLIVDGGGALDNARINGNVRVLGGQLNVRGAASGFTSGTLQGSGAISFVNGAVLDMPITALAGGTGFADRVVRLGLGSSITPAGSITMADGASSQTLRIIVDAAAVDFRGRIVADGRILISGQRLVNLGTIVVRTGVSLVAAGVSFVNSGVLSLGPGAQLSVTAFAQSASGVLETLVGAGGFGRVVAGETSLAGTLRVVSVGGWAGGAFSVVVASSRTGTFGTVVLPRPVGGFGGALGPAASVAYSSGGVVVLLPTDPSAVDSGVPSFAGLVSRSVGR